MVTPIVLTLHIFNQVYSIISPIFRPPFHYFPLDCFWLLDDLIQYCIRGNIPQYVSPAVAITTPVFLPEKIESM